MQVPLSGQSDVAGFHHEAMRLLAQLVPPREVRWSAAPAQQPGEEPLEAPRASIHHRAARAIIPQSFVRTSELAALHRDADRFDLLYRTLWRLVYEPGLKNDLADADLARLRHMAQSVRRDIQRMRSTLEFRTLLLQGRPQQVCWYEPAHHVCELVGAGLARKDGGHRWLLFTPDRSMRWDGARLRTAPPLPLPAYPAAVGWERWAGALEALAWL